MSELGCARRNMRLVVGVAAALAVACTSAGAARAQGGPVVPSRVCDVRQFGAEATRIWYDTAAFQKAIDSCAGAGGGTVRVPRGEYLIGPIFLRSNIRLELQKGAEVLAGTDPRLFRPGAAPAAAGARSLALINIDRAQNVAIVGQGLIDGQGAVWWERIREQWRSDPAFATSGQARQQQHDDRPRLIVARNSRNLLFEGVSIENSPSFHLVLQDSEDIVVRRVSIRAPAHAPNTDAIDPVNSRNVLIENNTISVGDDVVAIKSDRVDPAHPNAVSSNIVVRGNRVLAGRGICIGSGSTGGVRHVLVEDNSFDGSMYGIRIKTRRNHGGEVADVVFRNNRMTGVQTPIVVSSYYEYRPLDLKEAERQAAGGGFVLGNQLWPSDADPAQPFVQDRTPYIHDVVIDGLTATGADWAGVIVGLPERPIEGVRLRNVRIDARRGLLVRHARVVAQQLAVQTRAGPAIERQRGAETSGPVAERAPRGSMRGPGQGEPLRFVPPTFR
jgi:polygalacturonase